MHDLFCAASGYKIYVFVEGAILPNVHARPETTLRVKHMALNLPHAGHSDFTDGKDNQLYRDD